MSHAPHLWLRPGRDNLARLIVFAIGMINLLRGAAHLISADGGASGAGMRLDHSGAADLIYVFGVSGAFEVLLALWFIYVAVRQPALLSLMLWTQIAKSGLVLALGYLFKQPVGPPPGLIFDVGTLVAAVFCLVFLALVGRQNVIGAKST